VTRAWAPAFSAWLDDFLASYVRHRPVNATFIGARTYDDYFPDLSESGIAATLADTNRLLERLHALPDELLNPAEKLDRELAEGFLDIQRWELTSPHFSRNNPTLFTGEAVFGVLSLLLRPGLPFEDRLHAATARIAALPEFLGEAERSLRAAPAAWIERARRECTGAQLLLADLNLNLIKPDAAAAFAHFDAFLARELRATEDYSCGSEAFDLLLHRAHFLDSSVDELERLALERLAEEDAWLAKATPTASTPADDLSYLSRFESTWLQVRDLARARDLLSFPDWPVRYTEQPAWVRRAAPYLYFLPYRSPAPLDMPAVVDYYVPASADDATIKLNHVVHHGSLGHHVQNWHAARAASRIGRIAAVDCASRIAMLCGGTMAEGWACYATDLADEAGFLTPAERHAQHQTRRRIAARAIVDIRLHRGRLSLDEAAALYVERVGMTAAAAHAEAVKNSLFPGTACMYLAGSDAIRGLRRELESQLAPFSLREFHDRLLSFGSVPVSLVARAMLVRNPAVAHP
jgi:Bacterial protein of unknown function (DUF885)